MHVREAAQITASDNDMPYNSEVLMSQREREHLACKKNYTWWIRNGSAGEESEAEAMLTIHHCCTMDGEPHSIACVAPSRTLTWPSTL